MMTIRRLYVYAIILFSLNVALFGMIDLFTIMISPPSFGSEERLAQALALIIVTIPIFLLHWFLIQRSVHQDIEEKNAALRAIFFYLILLETLLAVAQELLMVVYRMLIGVVGVMNDHGFPVSYQSLSDNLIVIFLNLLVALYFGKILRAESRIKREHFSDVRRLYRYLWILYALLLVVTGTQMIVRQIISVSFLGEFKETIFVTALAQLIVGLPMLLYQWKLVQESLVDEVERHSMIRLVVLYLLLFIGVTSVICSGAALLDLLLRRLFGEPMGESAFVHGIADPISIGLPLAIISLYYGYWLEQHIRSRENSLSQNELRRPYYYILSFIGLSMILTGMSLLISSLIHFALHSSAMSSPTFRDQLSAAISALVIGLPLWWKSWKPMQLQVKGIDGDYARRSLVRRSYLYFVLFIGLIGGMGSAVTVVFLIINGLLVHAPEFQFFETFLNALQLLILFMVLLRYHWSLLCDDASSALDVLMRRRAAFDIVIVDGNHGGFGETMKRALISEAPGLPVTLLSAMTAVPPHIKAKAVIVPSSIALDLPDPLQTWLRGFKGERFIVADEGNESLLGPLTVSQTEKEAAVTVRAMAEEQVIHSQTIGNHSALMIIIYVFAGLFTVQLMVLLVLFGFSLLL